MEWVLPRRLGYTENGWGGFAMMPNKIEPLKAKIIEHVRPEKIVLFGSFATFLR